MQFDLDPTLPPLAGRPVRVRLALDENDPDSYEVEVFDPELNPIPQSKGPLSNTEDYKRFIELDAEGEYTVVCTPFGHYRGSGQSQEFTFTARPAVTKVDRVALVPDPSAESFQEDLWRFIKDVADGLRFEKFIERAEDDPDFCTDGLGRQEYGKPSYARLHGFSTDFVNNVALGLDAQGNPREELELSYVHDQASHEPSARFPNRLPDCDYPLKSVPFVELIFVYWMEEAMVFQSLNHIIARFQNRRIGTSPGPLARLAVSPLMPLRGILWSLAEAERDRLSVRRRAVEYAYEYGLQLLGRAIPPADSMVERRTHFLAAFHGLLNAAHHYYKERDDLTVKADAFPLLNSLRELHLVLARGANNQFADLPLTARIETLDVQWMLAQPEMHQFLGGPTMVPYEEPWMDRVDTMKSMFGWADASVTHFYDLAFHGEQLLLSARHGRWNEAGMTGNDAENWALTWRNSVQRYIHAYRSVTGTDLAQRIDTTMPSTLLSRRLAKQLA